MIDYDITPRCPLPKPWVLLAGFAIWALLGWLAWHAGVWLLS